MIDGLVMKENSVAASLFTSASGWFLQRRQVDPQSSLTVDPSVLGANLAQDGIAEASPGQSPSLTSGNNYINFCLGKTITNGEQVNDGPSCNPVSMGNIPSKINMPSCKFKEPKNFAVIKSNTNFDLVVNLNNFEAGAFANPATNFLGAPQQLGERGTILGYIRFVVQEVDTFQDLTPIDPNIFAFFRSANSIAVDQAVRTTVATGLANGTYRIAAMMTTSNHQPILFPVEQRGAGHDIIYITVNEQGPVPFDPPTKTVTVSPSAVESPTSKGAHTQTSSSAPSPSSSPKHNAVVGPAVGGSLGALVALTLAVGLIIFLRKRRRSLDPLMFPYAPASSQATLEQFTMEPLPQSRHSPSPNVRPNPLVISDSTPPPIPPKDQFAAVTRAVGDTTSSGSNASQHDSRMSWNEQHPTDSITITRSSRTYWDQRSTAPSEAPPPYMEEP